MNKIQKKKLRVACVVFAILVAMVYMAGYWSKISASYVDELTTQIELNEAKIQYLTVTQEQLHTTADYFRHEHTADDDFIQILGNKWSNLNNDIEILKYENEQLRQQIEKEKNKRKYLGVFELTAYCYGNITATGTVPKANRTIAVDPKVIPYGSQIEIEGYGTYIAEDCGGAVKGNIIDIYIPGYDNCIKFSRRKANVYLINNN